jgi:hypothetical protein
MDTYKIKSQQKIRAIEKIYQIETNYVA